MPFQKGQKVFVKAPPEVYIGTVIERRPGDRDLPEEQAHYEVRVEDERYYRSTDLEAVPPPKLVRYSKEWTDEFMRWGDAIVRYSNDKTDREAFEQIVLIGSKLGFFVPR